MVTFQITFNSQMEQVECDELTLSCLNKKVIDRFPSFTNQKYLLIGKKIKDEQGNNQQCLLIGKKRKNEDDETDKKADNEEAGGNEEDEETVSLRTEEEFQSFIKQAKLPIQLKIEFESNSTLSPVANPPPPLQNCIDCNEFFGHTEGRCSQCDKKRFFTPEERQLSARVAWAKTPMTTEELHCWVETGIREIQSDASCGICFEDHQELISNFACNCAPITCTSCNAKIERCPLCHRGKYRRISKEEIALLLMKGFSTSARKKIMTECLKDGYSLPFCFDQLICHASDIDEVIATLGPDSGRDNCYYMNSIYCLSIDYWTLQLADLHYVLCYKSYFRSNPDYVTSYVEICKHRKQMDEFEIMLTAFE